MASQSLFVTLTVELDVLRVVLAQLLDRFMNQVDSALTSHCLGGEITMHSCTVPVTCNRLRSKIDDDLVLLSNSIEKIPGYPTVVTCCKDVSWTNLVLPLCRHNLSVCARAFNSSVETSRKMSV